MDKRRKLKAAALYYAMAISLIIATLASLLILLAYYNRTASLDIELKLSLINNCQSGLEYLKSEDLAYGKQQIDLYGIQRDSVALNKTPWGLYEVFTSTAFHNKKFYSKSALIGTLNAKFSNTALYLSNVNKSLSISGKTTIKGLSYLPLGGVKRASIEGKNYLGSELVYGEILNSNASLPTLNSRIDKSITYANQMESDPINFSDDINLNNSFSDKTLKLIVSNKTTLSGVQLQGNIIIQSNGVIYIAKSAQLRDVLIIAEAVVVEDGFKGNVHIIAIDSAILGDNVNLDYPSSILVKSEGPSILKIGKNDLLSGTFVVEGKNEMKRKPFMSVSKQAEIIGDLYCNGIVIHEGSLYGSMFCEAFYLKTSSGVYENYLLDATIDCSNKSNAFVSGQFLEQESTMGVAKWLD